ncbi:MAG TPA: type II CAAX endopeptidase family protein [Xanthobacteraceae bacterium]|nr:type II CAAX endopeptidase family protein [Xanthobacteraceae bacterium]
MGLRLMGILDAARRPLRDLAIFVIGFAAMWTADVILAWRLGLLPEPARPWLRTALWIGAVGVWIGWQRIPAPARWLGLAPVSRGQAICAVIAFASIIAGNVLRIGLGGLPVDRLAVATPSVLAWSLVGVFVEELVFRGVVQTRLAEHFAAPLAIVVAAALFLLIHVPGWAILAIPTDPRTALSIFLIGAICGGLRHWSGSLWPAVAAHWANNLGAML